MTQTRHDAASPHADDAPPFRYNAALSDTIERRWQEYWEAHDTFVTRNPGDTSSERGRATSPDQPKFYCLDMFPYPSGAGLHVGHPEGYTATDIICRYKRMRGFRVLHPMGWDAFGLPAEQYAIQTGVHPAITTRTAIDNFRRQLKRFGFSYDWSREFATIDEDYYRWTQWIWLRAYNAWYDGEQQRARPIHELIADLESGDARIGLDDEVVHIGANAGALQALGGDPIGTRRWHELDKEARRRFIDNQRLAYLDEVTVNWCPKLGTVLANEEVIDGRSERGSFPVFRRPLRQWVFRITAFADRLLQDLDKLDWPDSTRTMQAEWIGRSEGAEIEFPITGLRFQLAEDKAADVGEHAEPITLTVFTTRPDTIFGATYMVVAPEHPLVAHVLENPPVGMLQNDVRTIRDYAAAARNRADVDRMADSKEKTGVFLGVYALNPANGAKIPVWVADYVLMGYGHGAIMAVPAHDERDFEFAQRFKLPVRDVVYSRTVCAMHYFALHASSTEQQAERWLGDLSDFLGIITSENTDPAAFPDALATVRSRRAQRLTPETGTVCELTPDGLSRALGTPVGERRGATHMTWMDAVEALGFRSFADFRSTLVSGQYYARTQAAYTGPGFATHSRNADVTLDGLPTDAAKQAATEWVRTAGIGRKRVNYRLRDWLFSRQRYWGEPFPIVYDAEGNHYPVSEAALPVLLPALTDYTPAESDDPQPLLAKAADWVETTAGEAGVSPDVLAPDTPVRRETNTMPGWAGSCWYYLRYCDPRNHKRLIGADAEHAWMLSRKSAAPANTPMDHYVPGAHHVGGVDLYVGGAEHAVLHLLYARFWHKILFDLGEVSTPEPFGKLFHQGLITSYSFQRKDKTLVPTDQVDEPQEGVFIERATGEKLSQVVAKMSKSLKNVVNPDDVIAEFGADTFRLYEMYMGPLEASKPWNTRDIVGLQRFLQRAWRLCVNEQTGEPRITDARSDAVERQLHRTIAKVGPDIERLAFNTAIAALIEFVNTATKSIEGSGGAAASAAALTRDQMERFALVMAPFTPHFAEELWNKLGHPDSLAYEAWPAVDESMLVDNAVEIVVQILGKVRGKVTVPAGADEKALEAAALGDEKIQAQLAGKTVKKVIVVPGRLVNIVAN
jgi:leucyl-tRNA synthetase